MQGQIVYMLLNVIEYLVLLAQQIAIPSVSSSDFYMLGLKLIVYFGLNFSRILASPRKNFCEVFCSQFGLPETQSLLRVFRGEYFEKLFFLELITSECYNHEKKM